MTHPKTKPTPDSQPAPLSQSNDSNDAVEPTSQEAWDSLTTPQQRAAVFRVQGGRETVEAFVVAFVLALLFRAFIAEAFVIPTGSMAPALMGAHKDIFCQECGEQFQIGASLEYRDVDIENVVVGGICPNCRYANSLDIENSPNDVTFSGDRILVSKFSYAIRDPERWDTIVFKVPVNPKQNYIKRLVGLPNEILSIQHGDVYALPGEIGPDDRPMISQPGTPIGEILRKPPSTLLAMKHAVYDSNHQSSTILKADFPARLQPWRTGVEKPPEDSWQVKRTADGLTATLPEDASSNQSPDWLRYYHHWPTAQQWAAASEGASLASTDPYQCRLITDFYAYDAYLYVDSDRVYDLKPSPTRVSRLKRLIGQTHSKGVFRPDFQSGGDLAQFRNDLQYGNSGNASEGMHWVGDLIVTYDLETSADAKTVILEIVEAGVRYQCRIECQTGIATLSINDGQARPFDSFATRDSADVGETDAQPNRSPRSDTPFRSGSRHAIRFSNCDNELRLWVDDDVMTFDTPTTFDVESFLPFEQVAPVYNGPGDPGDGSPVGVAVRGGSATLHRMTIDRDKYYIATNNAESAMIDYDMRVISEVVGANVSSQEIQAVMGEPTIWADFPGWSSRRRVSFPIGADQFFPMGDNSPESLDARCWAGTKQRYGRDRSVDPNAYRFADASYVPRDLLVGKALAIFWPHPWRTPLPVTPNVKGMKLIR